MAYIVNLEDGRKIEFETKPTDADIDEAAARPKASKPTYMETTPLGLAARTAQAALTRDPEKKSERYGRRDAAAGAFYGEQVAPLAHGASNVAFGLPKLAAEKIDPEMAMKVFAEQKTMGGKASRIAAEGAGYLYGGAAKLAAKTTKGVGLKLAGKLGTTNLRNKLLTNITSGAAGGAVAGGTQIIDPEVAYKDMITRQGKQAGGGALAGVAVGALFPLIRGIKNMKYVTNDDVGAAAMKKYRGEFYQVKKHLVAEWGNQVDDLAQKNPTTNVDLTNFIDDLTLDMNEMSPLARNTLKKVPLFKKLMAQPVLRDRVPLKDVQEAINYINTKIPTAVKYQHLDILDKATDLRAAQLDAFPEMANIRANYQQTIAPYNQVKQYFNFNKLEGAINNGFGGSEGRAAVKSLLPPETIAELGGIHEAQKVAQLSGELVRNLTIGISSAVGAGLVFHQLIGEEK